jgi:circadian clock protein KaiC
MDNMLVHRQATGIAKLDHWIGGIPPGGRNLVYGPPACGKTVFAMQFLWAGLQAGETVSFDVMDRPWTHMRNYFRTFEWDIRPYETSGRLIPIQAFPHFKEYRPDPLVRYFALSDFDAMQQIDLELSQKGVTRFVAGDVSEQGLATMAESQRTLMEHWTINWCHYSSMTNMDVVTESQYRDAAANRFTDHAFYLAHNVFRFRTREVNGLYRRELRIEKMEGVVHPLDWLPFVITPHGIELTE